MKRITLALAAVVTAAMLGLAGCGGSSDSDTPSRSDRDQFLKYSRCMDEQGVDVPDPQSTSDKAAVPPGSAADPKVEAANAVCRKYAPNQGSDDVSAEEEDTAVKTAECLRKHGVNATDPKPGTADISIEKGAGDTNEKIAAAYKTCTDNG
ncbi:hypothetical protein ACIHCV_38005 [Streptomyces sp. NPDC051956]|uniref:hypothetical protein n=1 Tax=Streptomyces sp. NPDC051956 TaxID=3365677 RepID=UPI0037D8E871